MAERRARQALPPLSSSSASSASASSAPTIPLPTSDQDAKPSSTSASAPDRRLLRSHYRSLKASIAEGKEILLSDDSNAFDTIVRRADDLYSLVSRPREQIADAEALLDISEAFLNIVKESRKGGSIKASDLVSSVIQKYREPSSVGENEDIIQLDWGALGLEATAIFNDAPGMSTMLGPMDSEAKKRKISAPRRRERGQVAEATRPQAVEDEAGEQRTETDKNIRVMFNVIRKCGENGCELEYLVLNRDSFAETVENIFFLSFLVKDGRAGITIENGKQIVVFKYAPTADERSGKSDGGAANGQVVNTQFVFRLDYKDWMIMKDMVETGKELMPKRGQSYQLSGSSATPIRKNSRNRGRVTMPETGNISIELGHCEDSEGDKDDEAIDHNRSRHRVKKLLI